MLLAVMQSFNRADLLARALPSLQAALGRADLPSRIVVFDAGSTDGSVDWLQDFQARATVGPVIQLVSSPAADRTLSFSEGTNYAVAVGLRDFPEAGLILLFESDNQLADASPIAKA